MDQESGVTKPKPGAGYILIKDEQPITSEGVLSLTRGNKKRPPIWDKRPNLSECFVHTPQAVRRAIKGQRDWMMQATTAVEAVYNSTTGYAEPVGSPIPFAQLVTIHGEH
jgi:hypothetical protein